MPHIAVPLRRVTRPGGEQGLATAEQDSPEEIDACVFAVLNTRQGHRTDLPEFGSPRSAHRRGGADLAALEHAVALWEPRADIIALRETGRLIELAREAGLDVIKIEGA
jgi:phage baseplate assembly protein W